MKSSKIISIGNRPFYKGIESKENRQGFQWKVGLIYIHRLRPNLNFCSQALLN